MSDEAAVTGPDVLEIKKIPNFFVDGKSFRTRREAKDYMLSVEIKKFIIEAFGEKRVVSDGEISDEIIDIDCEKLQEVIIFHWGGFKESIEGIRKRLFPITRKPKPNGSKNEI